MKTTTLLFVVLSAVVSVNAQKVNVGADPAVDVSKYKTYGWNKGPASSNPVIDQLIVTNVDREMTAKGLTKVTTDPELTVVAFAFTDTDIHESNPSWAPQLNSITTGIYSGGQSALITKGTLVVDMTDTKTKNGVWRGTATDTLKSGPTGDKAKDAKTAEKPIRKAVEKMFKQFPKPTRK
jgi:hypothetical protein